MESAAAGVGEWANEAAVAVGRWAFVAGHDEWRQAQEMSVKRLTSRRCCQQAPKKWRRIQGSEREENQLRLEHLKVGTSCKS